MGRLSQNVWRRMKYALLQITLTRFTLAFFLLSFTHCFAQGLIQAFLFNGDSNAQSLVSTVLQAANVSTTRLPWLINHGSEYELKLCTRVPGDLGPEEDVDCISVYPVPPDNTTSSPPGSRREDAQTENAPFVTPKGHQNRDTGIAPVIRDGIVGGVNVTLGQDPSGPVLLSPACVEVLQYPLQVVRFSKNEEIALVGSQFWLLGISIFAIVYQSIPHIVAAFCMRLLSTGWSAYTIWRTRDVHKRFNALVIDPGSPCSYDLFPDYFSNRAALQIPDLVLNISALSFTAFFGWFLIRDFATQTFRFAGPPPKIIRMYRYLLAVLVCLQLSLYLFITSAGLWADQLLDGPVRSVASFTTMYLALAIATIVTFVPWMSLGWYAVKKEKVVCMVLFLAVSAFYIVGSAVMFHSKTYDWTYVEWPFFASLTTANFIVFVTGTLFAVVCWINFHNGLAQYLRVEKVLADSNFQPDAFTADVEKNNPPITPVDIAGGGVKRDMNWDFVDDVNSRPAIYVVEHLHYGDGHPKR